MCDGNYWRESVTAVTAVGRSKCVYLSMELTTDFLRRVVFAGLRIRQPVLLLDDESRTSGHRLRVLQIANQDRAAYLTERLYGAHPARKRLGHAFVSAWPRRLPHHRIESDLEVVEINRLYANPYREAGYIVIPEWVEFGRKVIADTKRRYSGATKSLRRDLEGVSRGGYQMTVSGSRADFDHFYEDMYLPYVRSRFDGDAIIKSQRRLLRDFEAGFLLQLHVDGTRVAGATVREEGSSLRLTAQGILNGSIRLLNSHVSGAIDFFFHQYAADAGVVKINVGHTRPFPYDGVFYNKRKWQMSIMPDEDGVMNYAVKCTTAGKETTALFERCPFVFQGRRGLGVLCVKQSSRPLDFDEARKVVKQHWTPGLESMIALWPGGLRDGVLDRVRKECGGYLHFCRDMASAVDIYRSEV